MKAWWDAKVASTSHAGPASTVADAGSGPKRDRITPAFLIAMIAMISVNFGAVLGLLGWPVLQALGFVSPPAIEVVQRNQADLISQLDAAVHGLNAAVGELSADVVSAGDRQEAAGQHMADIDTAIGALRTSMSDMRAAQDAAKDSWRQPVAELSAAATRSRNEIVRLRASVEELRQHQPEAVAIGARIDRIEQAMVQHDLLGVIRGSIQEPGERPRSFASRESSSVADGHIIDLKPTQ